MKKYVTNNDSKYSRARGIVLSTMLVYVIGSFIGLLFWVLSEPYPNTLNEFFKDTITILIMLILVHGASAIMSFGLIFGEVFGLLYILAGKKWLFYTSIILTLLKSIFLAAALQYATT